VLPYGSQPKLSPMFHLFCTLSEKTPPLFKATIRLLTFYLTFRPLKGDRFRGIRLQN